MDELRSLGIPILEDCAYAVGSRLEGADVGRYGDFAIYSLPKFYPVEKGGLLVSRESLRDALLDTDSAVPEGYLLSATDQSELLRNVSFQPDVVRHWCKVRRDNWTTFSRRLAALGVEPYFELDEKSVPGVFVGKLPNWINGALLKDRFVNSGIEATEYYGHGGFYFPVHQFLSEDQIHLMFRLFEEVQ
jgi:dTDP-4-amino-4,6-dideoxygalactose transaminase